MKPYALKFVRFERIEDHFRQGWTASMPNKAMHHHHYGIEMVWLCNCPVPGGFKYSVKNRVPIIKTTESADERISGA
jgi:hypothetical protein